MSERCPMCGYKTTTWPVYGAPVDFARSSVAPMRFWKFYKDTSQSWVLVFNPYSIEVKVVDTDWLRPSTRSCEYPMMPGWANEVSHE